MLLNSTFRLSLSLSLFLIIGLFFFSGHRTSLRNDALVSFLFLLLLFSLQKKKNALHFTNACDYAMIPKEKNRVQEVVLFVVVVV